VFAITILIEQEKISKAYEILKNCQSSSNRYKFALLAFKMNKHEEAESALLNKKLAREDRDFDKSIPNGAAGYYLLGLIHHKKEKEKDAAYYFNKALELDPTLWWAFEKLSEYDLPIRLDKIFPPGKQLFPIQPSRLDQNPPFKDCTSSELFNANHNPSFHPSETKENKKNLVDNKAFICSPIHEKDSEDPPDHNTPTVTGLNPNYVTPTATGKNSSRFNKIGSNAPQQMHHESKLSGLSPGSKKEGVELSIGGQHSIISDGYSRTIGVEHMIKPFKITTPSAVGNQSNSKSSFSPKIGKSWSDLTMKEYLINDSCDLMWLLRKLGSAYTKQIKYAWIEAIQEYKKLPENQLKTGWVLTQIGRWYLDIQDYQEAEKIFILMKNLEPYTIEGLHYYSICLWHLKKQVELCSLCNFVLKKNQLAPETWIVVGNCYSLQNENEAAIKFFKRAIQLDKLCGMAFTLCGHEYFEIEDFEQSENYYKKGYTVDKRNYKSWWGVGNIYMKQEKYEKALKNFNMAARIYPKSSFIHTYIGMAFMHSEQTEKGLEEFERAHELNPSAPLNSFMRIQALTTLGRNDEALKLLVELIKKHPKEPSLHIHKGKLMKKLGRKEEALNDYNRALDLNPKDSNLVKNLIEKLNSSNDMNEDAEI
jgi:anaphase-promoting complex subunit 3